MPNEIPNDPQQMTDEQLRAAGMTDEQLAAELAAGQTGPNVQDLKTLTFDELQSVEFTPAPEAPGIPEAPAPESGSPVESPVQDTASGGNYGDGSCGGFPSSNDDEEETENAQSTE
jgi:hypothetical protein